MTLTTELTVNGKDFHVCFDSAGGNLMLTDYTDARAEAGDVTHVIRFGSDMLRDLIEENFSTPDFEGCGESFVPCMALTDSNLKEGFRETVGFFVESYKHLMVSI